MLHLLVDSAESIYYGKMNVCQRNTVSLHLIKTSALEGYGLHTAL